MRIVSAAVLAAGLATSVVSVQPASAGYYGGWNPGAAAAVGVLGGLAAGAAIASSRPAYPPPPAAYAPPPPAYGEDCYVVHRRVWVPGWGWDVRPHTVCE